MLSVACCMPSAVRCMLHAVCCMLHVACRLLHVGMSPVPLRHLSVAGRRCVGAPSAARRECNRRSAHGRQRPHSPALRRQASHCRTKRHSRCTTPRAILVFALEFSACGRHGLPQVGVCGLRARAPRAPGARRRHAWQRRVGTSHRRACTVGRRHRSCVSPMRAKTALLRQGGAAGGMAGLRHRPRAQAGFGAAG
jgi:hypothetical protein